MSDTNNTTRITSRFDRESSVFDVVEGLDLRGKNALVTGGGSGFGLATACALAKAGATVYIADVDIDKARQAAARFSREAGASLQPLMLDLASMKDVRRFAHDFLARVPVLHILVNNAGIMAVPQTYTKDGFELQFAVNYLGHYLLTRLLEPALVGARGARVVNISSIGHRRSDIRYDDISFRKQPFDTWDAYGQSKTACALLAVALDERLASQGVRSNTLNPGGSLTGLHEHLTVEQRKKMGWLDEQGRPPVRWRAPEQCASTATWLATAPELEGIGGIYFEECQQAPAWSEDDPGVGVKPYAIDPANARRLWQVSAEMVGLPA